MPDSGGRYVNSRICWSEELYINGLRGCLRRVSNGKMHLLLLPAKEPSVKTRRSYSTDLSDEEWSILEALVPQAKPAGRPPVPTTRASCSTPSSRWSGEDVLGGFCPTT